MYMLYMLFVSSHATGNKFAYTIERCARVSEIGATPNVDEISSSHFHIHLYTCMYINMYTYMYIYIYV